MRRDDAILLDVLQAARRAREFLGSLDKETFLRDTKTQSAVLHQLLILGESVKRLSDEFRQSHKGIPWKRVAGLRDVLIHQYEDVDLGEVWCTLNGDLPQLITDVEALSSAE